MIEESGCGISIASDGDSLVDTVRSARDDIVELVGHATRSGDVGDATRSVEFRHQNVVQHAARVADLETTRLETSHRGRSDYDHILLCGLLDHATCELFGNALRNDCYASNLYLVFCSQEIVKRLILISK